METALSRSLPSPARLLADLTAQAAAAEHEAHRLIVSPDPDRALVRLSSELYTLIAAIEHAAAAAHSPEVQP